MRAEVTGRWPGVLLRRRAAVRAVLTLVLGLAALTLAGCSAPTVWTAALPGPDRKFAAIARTIQAGGFGTANIDTAVYLTTTLYASPPVEVADFSCPGPVPHPYKLDNVRNAGGTIGLKMKWLGPRRLEITYSGKPQLYLKMSQLWGVQISVRRLDADGSAAPVPDR